METLLLAAAALANLTFLNIGAVRLLLHNGAAKVLVEAARSADTCSLFLKDQVRMREDAGDVGGTRWGEDDGDVEKRTGQDRQHLMRRGQKKGSTLLRGGGRRRRYLTEAAVFPSSSVRAQDGTTA